MRARRFHHLLILAHIWAFLPFIAVWLLVPGAAQDSRPHIVRPMTMLAGFAILYLTARTVLAWRDPRWLRWEYVFPPIDTLIISLALRIKDDPNSVLMYAYFLPIIEAIVTLEVRWAAFIGALSVAGAGLATYDMPSPTGPLATTFRFAFLVLMASLLSWLARFVADLRAELKVAADRNWIAMEMHDGVQAEIVGIALQLEVAGRVARQDGQLAASLIAQARDLARKAADDLRFVVQRICAAKPSEEFIPALRQYCHNLSGRTGLTIHLSDTGGPCVLPAAIEHALFRIIQESITNTVKHASASKVEVSVAFTDAKVCCIIEDDGRGFVWGPHLAEGHFGLQNIRERAEGLGGTVDIATAPGKGTHIRAQLPLRTSKELRSQSAAVDETTSTRELALRP